MTTQTYLEQFYEYIDYHLPVGVEIESLRAFHFDGTLIFKLWIDYNKFADKEPKFNKIPNAKQIFDDYNEKKKFIDRYKKHIIEKHKHKVCDYLNKHPDNLSFPEFIDYGTPEITSALLDSTGEPKAEVDLEFKKAISERNKEVFSNFTKNCLPNQSDKLSSLTISSEDLINILNEARQYNGNITLTQEEVFKMIVNADEYFSNIGDLDLFFSGLADSIVEYIERQEFMEEFKNGSETTADLSTT